MLQKVRDIRNIPLWKVNHSKEMLIVAQREEPVAYELGYEMRDESIDASIVTYKNFSDEDWPVGNMTDLDYSPDNGIVSLMCDFNKQPMCWALGQKVNELYLVFDEHVGENVYTSEHAITLIKLLKRHDIRFLWLYGDATSNQGTGRHKTNDWKEIQEVLDANNIGYKMHIGRSNPAVKNRVDYMVNAIYDPKKEMETQRRMFIVNRRCEWIKTDFQYTINDENGLPKKRQGDRGHMSDAIGYWIYRNIKKPAHYNYYV